MAWTATTPPYRFSVLLPPSLSLDHLLQPQLHPAGSPHALRCGLGFPRCIPVSAEGCEVVLCRRGLLLSSGTILTSVTLSTTATVHFTDVETKAQHDGSLPV